MSDVYGYAELLKTYIGTRGEPRTIEVERGAIRKFATATGDPNPEHYGDLAPPTFVAALRSPMPAVPEPDRPFRVQLHTDDELHLYSPLRAGDVVTVTSELTDVFVKEGRSGPMMFSQVTYTARRDGDVVSTVAWMEVQHR